MRLLRARGAQVYFKIAKLLRHPGRGGARARERSARVFHMDSAVRGACVRVNAHIIIYRAEAPLALQREKGGAEHAQKNKWNKWKNHFFKMKGDVGMV